MARYRESRNIEASLIEYIETQINASWDNINTINQFERAYDIELPVVAVRLEDTDWNPAEIGSNNKYTNETILIDIFASNDGQRMDLKDFIIDAIKDGCKYYQYTISNGEVTEKTELGRLRVLDLEDTPINFSTQKSELAVHDRYRHLINLTVSTGKVR